MFCDDKGNSQSLSVNLLYNAIAHKPHKEIIGTKIIPLWLARSRR